MARLSDKAKKQVSGPVMRRTDEHIYRNSETEVSRSGDNYIRGSMANDTIATVPDSDERWGKTQLDEDWPDE